MKYVKTMIIILLNHKHTKDYATVEVKLNAFYSLSWESPVKWKINLEANEFKVLSFKYLLLDQTISKLGHERAQKKLWNIPGLCKCLAYEAFMLF